VAVVSALLRVVGLEVVLLLFALTCIAVSRGVAEHEVGAAAHLVGAVADMVTRVEAAEAELRICRRVTMAAGLDAERGGARCWWCL
jgi:hypothetical protein